MVRGDVGQHARLVRLVADAAQDDAAAGGLEDGDVDVAAGRGSGALRRDRSSRPARPSARRRGRRPRSSSRRGGRPAARMWVISRVTVLLPFVPEIDTTGIAPVGVADPLRRRRARGRDPLGPAGQQPFLGTRQAGGPRRRHVALGQRQGRLGQGLGTLGADPRERDDPVARVGRAVDGHARRGPRRGRRAGGGSSRRSRRRASGHSRARDRRRRDGPARGGPGRAGRTTSAAGRRRPRA